jgi:hypothetical protein
MSIVIEATDTSKYDNATLIKSWAIVVADMFKDGSRPLEPGDPRRAELTARVQKTRPWFNADEIDDEDGSYKWDPRTLGMFYAEDVVQPKMPAFPVVASWVDRADISADAEHGCFDVTFESREYAPRGVTGDDGRISITFIRTIRVVTDPHHPQFDHDSYIAEIGELYEVTPGTVYPSGLDCTFTPADAYLIASALEQCSRDAARVAVTKLGAK